MKAVGTLCANRCARSRRRTSPSKGIPEAPVANFEARLELLQPGKDTSVPGGRGQIIRAQELDVPDLVALSGHDRAATLLEKVFTAEVRSASFHGERTRALAREVAVKMGARLKFAPWSLVDTLDSTGLYELLDKQFANDPNSAWQRRNADAYYLLGLIASNRTDDAGRDCDQAGSFLFGESFRIHRCPRSVAGRSDAGHGRKRVCRAGRGFLRTPADRSFPTSLTGRATPPRLSWRVKRIPCSGE